MRTLIYQAAIATLCCGLAVGLTLVRSEPFPRFYSAAYREYTSDAESSVADDGFQGLGDGIRSAQTFYWDEITSSKAFHLEFLHETGEGLSYPYGLPSVYTEKFLEAEERRSAKGLFLIVQFTNIEHTKDSASAYEPEALATFKSAEAAFLRIVSSKGASLKPVGPIRYYWRDRWLNSEDILFYVENAFPAALSGALLGALVLRRRSKVARLPLAAADVPDAENPPLEESEGQAGAAPRSKGRFKFAFSPVSFALGVVMVGVLAGVLVQQEVLVRPRERSEEIMDAFRDPGLGEQMLKYASELQADLLATRLQALAVRADYAQLLLSDPAISAHTLNHATTAIAEFLNSEGSWNGSEVARRLTDPVLRPIRARIMVLLKNDSGLQARVEAMRRRLLSDPESTVDGGTKIPPWTLGSGSLP